MNFILFGISSNDFVSFFGLNVKNWRLKLLARFSLSNSFLNVNSRTFSLGSSMSKEKTPFEYKLATSDFGISSCLFSYINLDFE